MLRNPGIQASNNTRPSIVALEHLPSSIAGWSIAALLAMLMFSTAAFAASEQVIHDFAGNEANPVAGVVFDGAGNLYGTTYGRTRSCGDVYELSPSSNGWQEKVLYKFKCGNDGGYPTAGVILDGQGNLYGTATGGGTHQHGVVFELIPQTGGRWREKVLYNFTNQKDGGQPNAVVFDSTGNLYGTTFSGGAGSFGVVFKLMPQSSGKWKATVLHTFHGKDGEFPVGSVVFDAAGNLYGAVPGDGTHSKGILFQLSPAGNGKWTYSILHSFSGGSDGAGPVATPIFDSSGNLYATTLGGGPAGWGTVVMLTPGGNGQWAEQVLYSFTGGSDGGGPECALVLDAAGNLYGTTYTGSSGTGFGTVFELSPSNNGWSETVLHTFTFSPDGAHPVAGVVFDTAGNLYGTTTVGGTTRFHLGTVFEVTP